ncbi:MAG: shikimate dehydrogenase [Eubacteriales bacterium]|nr:shikimate dehydrogenase [Eubacteriales bacterium]
MNYEITGHTRLTGLLGHPVSHSISPMMHNASFQRLGLDYVYLCFDVTEKDLKTAVDGLKLLNVRGFNCTMPDKTKICDLVDKLSPAARMIGAVNTVVNDDDILTGHNTDGIGYMQALAETGFSIAGKTMTLLGAGGAATAVCVQAALDGAASIHLFNRQGRSWNHAKELAERITRETSCHVELFDLADESSLKSSLDVSDLLTNATPIGMSPNETYSPIPSKNFLHESLLVSDIIYNPRETLLMRQAKEQGCRAFNGLYMLLYQGAEAFRIWTDQQMPVDFIKNTYFSK